MQSGYCYWCRKTIYECVLGCGKEKETWTKDKSTTTHTATEALKLLRHQRKGILELSQNRTFGQKRTFGCIPNNPCLKKLGMHGGLGLRATRWYILGRFATSLPGSPQQPKLSECLGHYSAQSRSNYKVLYSTKQGGFYCWSIIMIIFIEDQICCGECGNIV